MLRLLFLDSDGRMKSSSPVLKNLTFSCGIQPQSSAKKTYRVVGGEEVVKHEWPWQVLAIYEFIVV